MDASKRRANPNPRVAANPLSVLTFWWMKDLFVLGSKKDLEVDDLYDTLDGDFSEDLGQKLEENWRKELASANKKEKKEPSLLKALYHTFVGQYMYQGVILAFNTFVVSTAKPVLLGYLLKHFTPGSTITRDEAFYYAGGLIATLFLNLVLMHHTNLMAQRIGMRARIACCSLIYRKIMRLSKTALGQTAAGQMVNLLSNDVNRFDNLSLVLHYIWITPIETIIVTYFMWQAIGWASIIGVVGMFLQTVPVQTYMTKLTTRFRLRVAMRTDNRVRIMSEIISGIQVIKMYAWEKPFEKLVEIARRKEVKELRGANYLRGIYMASMVFTERSSLYIAVVAYALLGNTITADRVFSLAQFFNLLQLCMAIFYPQAVQLLAETRVSISRIQIFLMQEEHIPKLTCPSICNGDTEKEKEQSKKTGVIITDACAKWSPVSISETLTNVNLQVKPGMLCAIVGPVGAGKSSLLHAILHELPLSSGSISVDKVVSYASQEPWLFVGSVRQNILFGQPYDHKKYQQVVKVCALQRDFELFPFGDKTIVGERGVSLSGGQRARINLARAVYRDADVYLLDDPLSAVDTHVGKQLFQECIDGYLKTKTRILATHQLQYLKSADVIAIINNGRIEYQGTFSDILTNDSSFSNLLVSSQEESEKVMENEQRLLQKQMSVSSVNTSVHEDQDGDEPDESAEMIERGKLNKALYKEYITAGSSYWLLGWLLLVLIVGQAASNSADFWVTYWTNQEQLRMDRMNQKLSFELPKIVNSTDRFLSVNSTSGYSVTTEYNDTTDSIPLNDTLYAPETVKERNIPGNEKPEIYINSEDVNISFPNESNITAQESFTRDEYIIIYTVCIAGSIIITTYRSFVFFKVTMNSSQGLHNRIFNAILKGAMRFFDTNPSGRVLNRFSKDMGAIDEMLPQALLDAVQVFLVMTGILVMVVTVNYYFLIVIIIVGPLFYKIRGIYLRTAQDIKRLEGITRSPVFSYISASLNGLTTIRSSAAENMVMKEFDNLQDLHTSSWYMSIAGKTAFGFVLDVLSAIFVSLVILSFLTVNTGALSGYVGLAIAHSLILTGMVQYGIRQMTEVVSQMTSVERVLQYNNIEKEPSFESEPGKKPSVHWPQKGEIRFENLSLLYVPTEPPVLRELNFTIQAAHKVGIVGRTGAGKSSLIAALFRLAKLEGTIYIDNINTQSIGLHDLRKRISIIPQEPVLFSETIRYNLDPFQEFPDHQIWSALEEVELKDAVDTLEYHVNEGGSNFSAGQRQLICLARAILRNNKVLVLDEATANVDPQTDSLIQKTIRKKFKDCTVLTIAHRLNTIMDSDKVLVMDSGTMVEYAHPHELLQNPEGYFYKMVQQTGKSMESQLRQVAQEAYDNIHSSSGA
ncbi:ATP-binding cassette sub-family C member 4-like isoform X1 [Schistocerca serialis cubense]|uniref:ATP-binding cassette sub-family C member 4-like isoform X1 n=1 Tax=Schistocerca serialis cubense TaxID=2023355 RepID=UPI00214EBDFB|nr:ATP-binding cassette sub-family C member 4-like isoform X1 [Schistocerca serialis cubense]